MHPKSYVFLRGRVSQADASTRSSSSLPPSCHQWLLLLPALIVSLPQFQLEKLLLAARGSPDSMLERSVEVRVQGQWGENSRTGGIGLGGLEGGGVGEKANAENT